MAGETELGKLVIRLTAETAELRKNIKDGQTQINQFASDAKKILATVGISLGIREMVQGLKEILNFAIDYNSEIEQQKLGIAALITATNEVTDGTGRVLTGQEKLNAALKMADDLYAQIQVKAMMTAATTPEIVQGFQSMVAPGQAAGLSLSQILDLSVLIVQAMQAMQLPLIQMRVEARGLLTGEESVRMDLMKNLNIRGEIVKQMREEGRLYEYLMQQLSSFTAAGEKQLGTWQGLKSSMKDVVGILGSMALRPIFEAATTALKNLMDVLVSGKGKMIEFSDTAKNIANDMKNSVTIVIEHFKAMKEEYGAVLTVLGLAAKTALIGFGSFFTGLTTIWMALLEINYELLNLIDVLTLHAIPGMDNAIKRMEERMKSVRESLNIQTFAMNELLFGKEKTPEPVGPTKPAIKLKSTMSEESADMKAKREKRQEMELAIQKKTADLEIELQQATLAIERDNAIKAAIARGESIEEVERQFALRAIDLRLENEKKAIDAEEKLILEKAKNDKLLNETLKAKIEEQFRTERQVAEEKAAEDRGKIEVDISKEAWKEIQKGMTMPVYEVADEDWVNKARQRLLEIEKVKQELSITGKQLELDQLEDLYQRDQVLVYDYYGKKKEIMESITQIQVEQLQKEADLALASGDVLTHDQKKLEITAKLNELARQILGIERETISAYDQQIQRLMRINETQRGVELARIDERRSQLRITEGEALQQKIGLQQQYLSDLQWELSTLQQILSQGRDLTKDQTDRYNQLQLLIAQTNGSVSELQQKLNEQTGGFFEGMARGWKEFQDQTKTAYQSGSDLVKDVVGDIKGLFSEILKDGKITMEDLKKTMLSIWNKIMNAMMDAWINDLMKLIKSSMSSSSGGFFGSILSALGLGGSTPTSAPVPGITSNTALDNMGGFATLPYAKGAIFPHGFTPILKMASGAVFDRPTLGVVGEAGTEILSPEGKLRQIFREESRNRAFAGELKVTLDPGLLAEYRPSPDEMDQTLAVKVRQRGETYRALKETR